MLGSFYGLLCNCKNVRFIDYACIDIYIYIFMMLYYSLLFVATHEQSNRMIYYYHFHFTLKQYLFVPQLYIRIIISHDYLDMFFFFITYKLHVHLMLHETWEVALIYLHSIFIFIVLFPCDIVVIIIAKFTRKIISIR